MKRLPGHGCRMPWGTAAHTPTNTAAAVGFSVPEAAASAGSWAEEAIPGFCSSQGPALTLWLHPWLPLGPLLLPSSGQRGWVSEAESLEQMSLPLLQQHLILGNLTYGSCFPHLELSYHGCQVCL